MKIRRRSTVSMAHTHKESMLQASKRNCNLVYKLTYRQRIYHSAYPTPPVDVNEVRVVV